MSLGPYLRACKLSVLAKKMLLYLTQKKGNKKYFELRYYHISLTSKFSFAEESRVYDYGS